MNRSIRRVGLTLLAGFVVIALSLAYWQVIRANDLTSDPRYNRFRLVEAEKSVQRGQILDRNGAVLVQTEAGIGGGQRTYSTPSLVHVTGFHSTVYGDTNVEEKLGGYLRGEVGLDQLKAAIDKLLHRQRIGADVVLTIDSELQNVAETAMGQGKGAAVVMDPRTGEILALVSHPYFDPNTIDQDWQKIRDDSSAPLLNRATQGLYVPGSTFKTVTLAAALDAGVTNPSEVFDFEMKTDDRGRAYHTENVSGYEVFCANHGMTSPGRAVLQLADVYASSCNVAFARLGLRLGGDKLADYAKRFGLEGRIPFELDVASSRLSKAPNLLLNDRPTLAATSFGQGQLQVTPLQLAMVAATVARDGTSPEPYIVKEIRAGDLVTGTGHPKNWRTVMSAETARQVKDMMVHSVDVGWASGAKIPGVKVAGKTGTAEVAPDQPPHALFIGFAPADNPIVAVAVVKENAGTASSEAVPAARKIIEAALARQGN